MQTLMAKKIEVLDGKERGSEVIRDKKILANATAET